MQKLIKFFADSFRNDKAGGSARKLTAFTLIGLLVGAYVFWYRALYFSVSVTDKLTITPNWATSIFIEVVGIALVGAAFFLGMITYQNLLEFKNGRSSETKITEIRETETKESNEPNQT